MKKLLLLLMFLPAFASGQTGPHMLTFDAEDTLYPHVIVIDTINYHHNIWQIGKPHKTVFDSAYSYPNAIVTDTLNPYPPNDTSVFYVKIPGDVNGWWPGGISFYYQLDIDSGSFGEIDYSSNNGGTWTNILSSSHYFFLFPDTPSLSLSTHDWMQWGVSSDFDLCDTFIYRFTFISDSAVTTKNGWIIDNINYRYNIEGIPTIANQNTISIFPNPACDEISITSSSQAITRVEITDMLGRQVYLQTAPANCLLTQVDVAELPCGVYFVKVNNTEVRKFVKQ